MTSKSENSPDYRAHSNADAISLEQSPGYSSHNFDQDDRASAEKTAYASESFREQSPSRLARLHIDETLASSKIFTSKPDFPLHNFKNSPTPSLTDTERGRQLVKWGIKWTQPFAMIFFLVAAALLAVGHHLLFTRLDGELAGSASRQQWAIAFGTAFSFLVISLLHAAAGAAYNEYLWMLVRDRPIRLRSLDKLFALMTDPKGFASFELWRHARLAMLLGIICW